MISNLFMCACAFIIIFIYMGFCLLVHMLGSKFGLWDWLKNSILGELTRPLWDFEE